MVHLDAADSVADLEVAWVQVAEVVKSMFPTFVASILYTFELLLGIYVDLDC